MYIHRITHPHQTGSTERCVDNAIGLDGQRCCRCARQLEVQSKVDVLSAPPATVAEAAVQAEHRLNLARQIGKNGYKNRSPVFSYERSPSGESWVFTKMVKSMCV